MGSHHPGNLVVAGFAIATVYPQGRCDSIDPVAVVVFFLDSFDSSTENRIFRLSSTRASSFSIKGTSRDAKEAADMGNGNPLFT